VLTKLAALSDEEKASGVIAISAGNHRRRSRGQPPRRLTPCRHVVRASEAKIAATRGYGAAVDPRRPARPRRSSASRCCSTRPAARSSTRSTTRYDRGAGTVGLEILEDVEGVETIVVPIGGGGLIAGVAVAAAGRARVIGVEPELSTAMHSALAAGAPVDVAPRSIADGLNAPYAGQLALGIVQEHVEAVVLVSEDEIAEGFRFLYERAKLACDPRAAAGAVLAGKVRAAGRPVSSRAGTSQPAPPLVSWQADEGRHPSRIRPRPRDVLVRQRVRPGP
jgi:threonine dehydratase